MAERSYFVKLNLDDMAASLDALDSTEERGQWLEGFRVGSRGNAPRDGWPEAKAIGHSFGLSCWEKAEEFREKQSAKGRASGMARSHRTESEPESNHGSTTVQPRMNQTPNREGTNQKPEARSQQQEAISEHPSKQPSVVRDVVEYWNDSIKGTAFPSARHTDPRGRVIATRVKDPSWFDDFKKAVAYIKTDPFYQGAGNTSWVASIDYLLQAGKATELAEKSTARPMKSQSLKPQINGFTPEMYGGANAPDQW